MKLPSSIKRILRAVVDGLLGVKGIILPDYFHLRQRLAVFLGDTEPDLIAILPSLLSEGIVVLDIGANVGLLTRHFCRMAGATGKVLAFEPDPTNFRCLEYNTRRFKNVELFQAAISDAAGPSSLNLDPVSGMGHSLFKQGEANETVAVDCIVMDRFLAKRELSRIDLIKIDVEGAELHVLHGMRETIRNHPETKIIIEFCPKNLTESGVDPKSVVDELLSHELSLKAISATGKVTAVNSLNSIQPHFNANGYVNILCSR
jgi:FkbM family methyltransferase